MGRPSLGTWLLPASSFGSGGVFAFHLLGVRSMLLPEQWTEGDEEVK
jgi:hypothetical protein